MLKSVAVLLMMMPLIVFGKIIETDTFEDVTAHLCPNTLIFCDLDNTLIEPNQLFGTVQWGDNHQKKLIKLGETPEKAEEIVHSLWLKMLPTIPMRLVDIQAPSVIHTMREQGYVVLGLTARYAEEAFYTHAQLEEAGIRFDSPYADREIMVNTPVIFEKGILFCSARNKKSDALIAFLKQFGLTPSRIIFVDDKLSHVKDLENTLTALNIDYVGVRFSKTDTRVYDPVIADIQWNQFPPFITDEEAYKILSTR